MRISDWSSDVCSSDLLLREQVAGQCELLSSIARAEGTVVSYVKPHGALYNRIVDDAEQAAAVLAGTGDLPVLGLPGGVFLALAEEAGRAAWREGFPDRSEEHTSELQSLMRHSYAVF